MQMHSSPMSCLVIFTIPGDDTRRPRQSKNAPPETWLKRQVFVV